MTRPEECSAIQDVVKLLATDGFDGLGEAIRRIINEAMRLERQNYLGVGPYERSDERRGYANGYKPKTVQTRVGALDLDIPQVRDSSFYPSSLEKGLRSDKNQEFMLLKLSVVLPVRAILPPDIIHLNPSSKPCLLRRLL